MTASRRLDDPTKFALRRGRAVSLTVDGELVTAFEGETIGAALCATGHDVLSRSIKYHRPRGLLCMAGTCPNCLMTVDGIPNVRVCREPVRDGMVVATQDAWPSAERDVFAVADALGWAFPLGFQYRYFKRARWLYHRWERFLRHRAGHGRLPDVPPATARKRFRPPLEVETDVTVVGAGPAGAAAALTAVEAGARCLLVDRNAEPSKAAWLLPSVGAGDRGTLEPEIRPGIALREALRRAREHEERLTVHEGTAAVGVYGDLLLMSDGSRVIHARYRSLVVATGLNEAPALFRNNDLPGVLLAGAVVRLVAGFGVVPGRSAVVATDSDDGYRIAQLLRSAGVDVRCVVDRRQQAKRSEASPVRTSAEIIEAAGKLRVKRVKVGSGAGDNAVEWIGCDLVCLAYRGVPALDLVFQRTAEGSYVLEPQGVIGLRVTTDSDMRVAPGLYVAGACAGARTVGDAVAHGRVAGAAAARDRS